MMIFFNALAVANQINTFSQEIGTQKAAKRSLQTVVPTARSFLGKARTAISSSVRDIKFPTQFLPELKNSAKWFMSVHYSEAFTKVVIKVRTHIERILAGNFCESLL